MPRRRLSRRSDSKLANLFSRVSNAVSPRWLEGDNTLASRHPVARAASYRVDVLEKRWMFHTIGFDAVNDVAIPDGTYEYLDEKLQVIRVAWHDVIAELVGVTVDSKTDITTQTEMVTAANPEPTVGANLFTIYVIQANLDSFISIAQVPATSATGPRNMEPFTGSAGPFNILDPTGANPRNTYSPPGGSGAALLGGTYFGPKGSAFAADEPFAQILTSPNNALGVYPGDPGLPTDNPPVGRLNAGLYMTPVKMNPTTGAVLIDPATGLEEPNDLGRFFFGGTIFGNVDIPAAPVGSVAPAPASQGGNIGVFYAGALLLGDPGGVLIGTGSASDELPPFPSGSNFTVTSDFQVGGDIRDLVTNGPIGGAPFGMNNYLTGFHAVIAGSVGEMNLHQADMFGTFDVQHNPAIYGLPENLFAETELEVKGPNAGVIFQGGLDPLTGLTTTPALSILTNDTPATPQYLGSQVEVSSTTGLPLHDVNGNLIYEAFVSGTIQGGLAPALRETGADYYAVALMAGQTITVTPNTGLLAQTQILDPDGRIVASDNNFSTGTVDKSFQYTADRPGVYDIGVLDLPNVIELEDIPYTLEVQGIGDMGLAAVATQGGTIFDGGFDTGFEVDNGDLGAMVASVAIKSTAAGPTELTLTAQVAPRTVLVGNGNLRAMTAATLGIIVSPPGIDTTTGFQTGAIFGDGPSIDVPNGSVGLLQAKDPSTMTGILDVQTRFDPSSLLLNQLVPVSAIGGDIQRIVGASTTFVEVAANGGMGSLDAANMATSPASFIEVNADNKGSDGIIDMISCPGQFGVLGGGPEFITNQGGDIRYMNLTGPVFKDQFFGGTELVPTQYPVGQAATMTDDSGAVATFTPVGQITTTTVTNPNGTITTTTTGPQISLEGYPVRDKGGLVPISATSTGSMTITASGLSGSNSSVEIGSVQIQGIGRAITATGPVDLNKNPTLVQTVPAVTAGTIDPTDLELNVSGSASVDILNVGVNITVAGNAAVAITNETHGEIVGVTGSGVGTISALGNIGLATPHGTPAAVLADTAILSAYPFDQQTTGLNISGSVITISAGGAIGNINVFGDIENLIADAGGKTFPGLFAGIDGAVVVGVGDPVPGRILNVSIGQGILPSGTGVVGFAGLYATGKVGTVSGSGTIRGNIISNETEAITQVGIDGISLSGQGSIIGSVIAVFSNFVSSDAIHGVVTVPSFTHPAGTLVFDIGHISVNGTGGIIGTQVDGDNIGPIDVSSKGFGVLNSFIESVNIGVLAGISAGGYGIRGVTISGGADVGSLGASGNGSLESVLNFSTQLLVSNVTGEFDPFFGIAPSIYTDLNAALGTSLASPNIPGVTDTGVIADTVAQGSGNFGTLAAHTVRTSLPLFNPGVPPLETPSLDIPIVGQTFAMSLAFGGSVTNVFVTSVIDGLQITTGSLKNFRPTNSVSRLGISVAGEIRTLRIIGNLGQQVMDPIGGLLVPDSYVNATGPDGSIVSMIVTGNLNASVTANGFLGNIVVAGNVTGSLTALGHANGLALKALRVGGSISGDSLTVDGSAGSITTNGSFGTVGDSLTIVGNLNSLTVGATRGAGHALNSAVHVEGTLNQLRVNGLVNGAVTVDTNLNSMQIFGIGPAGMSSVGSFTVGGRLNSAVVSNQNIAGTVSVNGSINSFTIARGSVLVGATIKSDLETIRSFRITGGAAYGMLGTLAATNGTNMSVDISGNVGDGVHAASIVALSGAVFHIRGSILTDSSILVDGPLGLLDVDGNINAGASVTAHPLVKLKVGGSNQGTITPT